MHHFKRSYVWLPVLLTMLIIFGSADVIYSEEKSEAEEKDADDGEGRKLPQLAPGRWEPIFELGDSIYPSLIISTATIKVGLWDDNDKNHLGDRWGIIGVAVRGTKENCPIDLEVSGGNFIKPSVFSGELPDKNTVYSVYPTIRYDYAKLLAVKQTMPETVTFKVKIDGKTLPEKDVRIQVRPVNECLLSFTDTDGNANDVSYFLAAYVNENHPFIEQILKEAIQSGGVDSFSGYSDDDDNKESIMTELKAVWASLQARGIHYSDISATSDDDNPYLDSQYVRLLGESINYTQANCVDGSVLMASIFRKLGLNPSLITVPGHMFLGVSLDQEGKDNIYIETTDLGQSTFEEAIADGKEAFDKGKGKFNSDKDEDEDYKIINVRDARGLGIMPIKDSSEKKIVEKGSHPTIVAEDADDE